MIETTRSGNVEIRFAVDGREDAPPLLLLNSLGTSMEMWGPQIPLWAGSRRLVRLDNRGHGLSSVPPPPYAIDDFGRDALAVLDRVGTETVDVCGISLGGLVAIWLAAHHPQRIRRAVFASTAGRIGDEEGWRARARTVLDRGMEAVVDMVLGRFFSEPFRTQQPETVESIRQGLLETDPSGYAGACLALAEADLREDIASITAPALVVVGRADVATPVGDARSLCDALVTASLRIVDDAGHLTNLEAPGEFGRAVEDFLDDAPGEAG